MPTAAFRLHAGQRAGAYAKNERSGPKRKAAVGIMNPAHLKNSWELHSQEPPTARVHAIAGVCHAAKSTRPRIHADWPPPSFHVIRSDHVPPPAAKRASGTLATLSFGSAIPGASIRRIDDGP